jgi:hypothetical protein
VKTTITEVELGSTDYTVIPLNSREKRLLKAPSSAHYHKLLLEAIASANLVFKDVKRTDKDRWTDVPYMVSFGYGWVRARSAKIFLSLSNYKVRLTERGAVSVVESEHSGMKPIELVDLLLISQKAHVDDKAAISSVLSTVSVQLERKIAEARQKADRRLASPRFQAALHRWVNKKMAFEMRADLAPLLTRYPADALAQRLAELVVEGVHDL